MLKKAVELKTLLVEAEVLQITTEQQPQMAPMEKSFLILVPSEQVVISQEEVEGLAIPVPQEQVALVVAVLEKADQIRAGEQEPQILAEVEVALEELTVIHEMVV